MLPHAVTVRGSGSSDLREGCLQPEKHALKVKRQCYRGTHWTTLLDKAARLGFLRALSAYGLRSRRT